MTRVVLVHGFTQTGASWAAVAGPHQPAGHDVECPDLPGHGTETNADPGLWAGARSLGERAGRALFVGYSMGGRYCLHLALERPDLVDALVLVGATPGIEDEDERAARRAADDAMANGIQRDGVDAFLERWLENPLFASLPREAAAVDSRRANSAAGLAASLRRAGTGTQTPLWHRLAELTMPVLLVTGGQDEKFTAIASRMAASIPAPVERVVVDGVGHAVPLEAPARFATLIAEFAERTGSPGRH